MGAPRKETMRSCVLEIFINSSLRRACWGIEETERRGACEKEALGGGEGGSWRSQIAPAEWQGPELGPGVPAGGILASVVERWQRPEAFNLESDHEMTCWHLTKFFFFSHSPVTLLPLSLTNLLRSLQDYCLCCTDGNQSEEEGPWAHGWGRKPQVPQVSAICTGPCGS